MDGYVAYYNFCRKHQSIQKTPAQAAGLEEIKGWKQLINKAQVQKTRQDLKRQTSLEVKVIV